MKLKTSLILLILAALAIWAAVFNLPDNNLHVYFCDVGQGDAALIVHGSTQILIDTGPDNKVLDCLSAHVPFYDHKIESVIITHPQQDHMGGLISVINSYTVMQLFIPPAENNIRVYRELLTQYALKKIPVANTYSMDVLKFNRFQFQVVWPEKDFVLAHAQASDKVLGWKSDGTDLNSFSIVGILTYGNFDILFTGDADAPVELAEISTGLLRPVEVLKVPHHGSKTGMLPEWLEVIRPQMAVISVGKTNNYGHPTQQALDLLSKFTSKIYRTDEQGTIELISDGKNYWVK